MEDKKKSHWQNIIEKKLVSINSKDSINKNSDSNNLKLRLEACDETVKQKVLDKPDDTSGYKLKVSINEHGTITLKPSNKVLANILFELDDTVYDVKRNEWRITHTDYLKIRKTLKSSKFVFKDVPKGPLNILNKPLQNKKYELTGDIYNKMFVFQKEGVNFELNRGGRVILGDDMGLGKTVQALGIALYYKLEWPLLIIAPASLLDNWAASIQQFLGLDSKVVRSRTEFGDKISIISYDMCSRFIDIVKLMNYGVVVVDECHYIKSATSKRTKNILPILQNAGRLVLMSGTPAVSRPLELYTIISAIDKNLFPNFSEYGMRYCNGRKIKQWYDYKGCSNAEELNYILNKYFMIRRLKDEVLSQLPPKSRRQIIINCGKKLEIHNVPLVGDNVEQTVMSMYNDAAVIKLDPVKLYIDTILERDVKFIIFAHHNTMMEGLSDYLKEKKVNFIKMDGSVPTSHRHKMVQEYQNNDNVRVALLSVTACNTGLTLTSGKLVVFAELYWNPGTLLQAEDRIHRIGQSSIVDIHYLVCKGTVDEYVWPVLIKKLNVLQSLGMGKNNLKNAECSKYDIQQTFLDEFIKKG
jgi:SWI/SNF-related matrix-associated actin-dependent regulator of chromatin subfamily A-like protein 1